jgi:hypothetical protein
MIQLILSRTSAVFIRKHPYRYLWSAVFAASAPLPHNMQLVQVAKVKLRYQPWLHEKREQTCGHECSSPDQVEIEPGLTEKTKSELPIDYSFVPISLQSADPTFIALPGPQIEREHSDGGVFE